MFRVSWNWACYNGVMVDDYPNRSAHLIVHLQCDCYTLNLYDSFILQLIYYLWILNKSCPDIVHFNTIELNQCVGIFKINWIVHYRINNLNMYFLIIIKTILFVHFFYHKPGSSCIVKLTQTNVKGKLKSWCSRTIRVKSFFFFVPF